MSELMDCDLRSLIYDQGHPMGLEQTKLVMAGILKGLAEIHSAGVVHRDIRYSVVPFCFSLKT